MVVSGRLAQGPDRTSAARGAPGGNVIARGCPSRHDQLRCGTPLSWYGSFTRSLTTSALHDVTVQVVPFTADAHAALGDQFEIIQWPLETDPEAVYVDGQTSWVVHERNREVRQYTHAFASVQSKALSPSESIALIGDLIEELPA